MRTGILSGLILVSCFAFAQPQSGDMAGMDMSHSTGQAETKGMHEMPGMGGDGSGAAMHAMEAHHMDMGPHMKMTAVRSTQPGDQEKADQIVQAARTSQRNTKTTKLRWPTASKSFYLISHKSNTGTR